MRYINNAELREWVKDNLRKAIFQKAHALAVQTGCEVLVKLEDVVDTLDSQCYATDTLQKTYFNNQLKRSPGELVVSGETGLPLTTMIDRASQMSCTMLSDNDHKLLVVNSVELPSDDFRSSSDQIGIDEDRPHIDIPNPENGYVHDDGMQDDQMQGENDTPDSIHMSSSKMDDTQPGISDVAQVVKEEIDEDIDFSIENTHSADLLKPMGHTSSDTILPVKSEPQINIEKEEEIEQILPLSENNISAGSSIVTIVKETIPEVVAPMLPPTLPMTVISPSIRPYQCGVCQKTFGSIQVLSRHAQTFHGMNRGMRYYCNICGQSYKLAQYLQAHVRMHDTVNIMPVLCKVCGMGYYSQAALKQHQLTHTSSPTLEQGHIKNSHTVTSHTVTVPPLVQSKPNPRLQLAKSTSAVQKTSASTSVLASSITQSLSPTEAKQLRLKSPPDAKRFCPTSPTESDKEESYLEPKQYHCLVCGMAFEEGEQLEEHVMIKHMHPSEEETVQSGEHKTLIDLAEDENLSDKEMLQEGSQNKDEVLPSNLPDDIPGNSDAPLLSSAPVFYAPFSATEKSNLAISQTDQQSFSSAPLFNANPNITSVLEQALPGLLPGMSLLTNPSQLPMAQAAASIAQSEGRPPMVSLDGRFTCDICGNSYKYNCTLKEHRLTHAQTPLFTCKICNQAFSRQRQLRDHMFRHSGAYPYHCKLCGKGFVRPSILRRHETDRHKQAWENLS